MKTKTRCRTSSDPNLAFCVSLQNYWALYHKRQKQFPGLKDYEIYLHDLYSSFHHFFIMERIHCKLEIKQTKYWLKGNMFPLLAKITVNVIPNCITFAMHLNSAYLHFSWSSVQSISVGVVLLWTVLHTSN